MHYDGISEVIFDIAAFNIMTGSRADPIAPNETEIEAGDHLKEYLSTFLDPDGFWGNMRFAKIMADLTSCSLVDFDQMNLTYSVHVLIQDWMRTVIPQPCNLALECTATLLSMPIDADWEDEDSLAFRRNLVRHVNSILRHKPVVRLSHASNFAVVSAVLQEGTLDKYRQSLGGEHPATLRSMNHLAVTYARLGQQNEGSQLEVQVVDACSRVLGEEDQNTLRNIGNLALTYSDLGRWDEALKLQIHVLSVHKCVMAEEHEDTVSSMHDLAATYSKLGRWKEAEQMQVQILRMFKRVLGVDHPNTLAAMNNLAVIYSSLGRQNEMEKMQVQVVGASKRVLGGEHPDTLRNMANLGSMYSDLGRLKEAEDVQIKALKAHRELLGEEHPDTQKIMSFLASTYSRMSQWAKRRS
ncbi:hypothetical protein FRC11_004841 [Ceratobasidium sp. 423]|nr:hypothetical protein FRC11_004841 [Ceratobasidium sp. 423]